ncbi:MAG: cell envelope integrity protein CreD [Litorimonas sp.]
MSGPSTLSQSLKPPSRSLGLKLIVILFLVVLMAIPVMFISFISFERASRADEVTREVSQTYGGAQRLLGPVLVVPYRQTLSGGRLREGDYLVSALSGSAVLSDVGVEEKSRSLYKVPVYTAQARLSADLPSLDAVLPSDAGYEFDVAAARIVVGLGDVRGLQADVTLSKGGTETVFEPFTSSGMTTRSVPAVTRYDASLGEAVVVQPAREVTTDMDPLFAGDLTLLSVPANGLTGGEVEVRMAFTGASRLSVLPFARSTTLEVSSDWPHPGFSGAFPPAERNIAEDGFSARWSVPFLRRGIPAQGRAGEMPGLTRGGSDMQVNFVSPLNPYQTVNRALKYAVLFIGLVFLAYFLMETLLGVRVHPAQYLLIGIAQAVFYLLLLAFAEHVGFTVAFALSAVATVALTAGYAGAVFGRSLIWTSAAVFGAVYGLLFVLMRIQDFALMVGALISFVAVAATLYLTRDMDWYGERR